MRCKNCGWPNKPQVKVCVKCHAPLDASDDVQPIYSQSDNQSSSFSEPSLKKTTMEADVFGDSVNAGSLHDATPSPTLKACPKCGYALRPYVSKCPNCNYTINQDENTLSNNASHFHDYNENPEPSRRSTRMENAGRDAGKMRGTVNPYMMNLEIEPTFALKPMKRISERKDFEELEFEGKEVVLNRDNTESNNSSITSREQAIITRLDGHWFIEDKSEQRTTFVQAAKKIELHEGDIILLGNRMFEFHG